MGKEKKTDLLNEGDKEFFPSAKRDIYYSALVKDIVKNNRSSQVMKYIFFGLVCVVFFLTCAAGMYILFYVAKKDTTSVADLGVVVGAFGSILSSIIVLPQTIATHLFPADSEKARFSFIKDNQQYDTAIVINNGNTEYEDERDLDEGSTDDQ